jgi:very-short-patch-repair endonuclease
MSAGGQPRGSLSGWLEQLQGGRARLLVSDHAGDAVRAIEAAAGDSVVVTSWLAEESAEAGPTVARLLDDVLAALANAALRLFPAWGEGSAISPGWREEACRLASLGRVPLLADASRAVQCAQLALAIGSPRLLLVLADRHGRLADDDLLGVARAAEWMASETGARVVAVVRAAHAHHPALDAVAYGAARIVAEEPAPDESEIEPDRADGEAAARGQGARARVWPLLGQPHPQSRGEQILARCLRETADLGPLFEFNVLVVARSSRRFIVDLLWREGKVVVEVDSYYYHSGPAAFVEDRERDRELLVSGYRVVRIPHDDILRDSADVVERIREVVAFVRESQST